MSNDLVKFSYDELLKISNAMVESRFFPDASEPAKAIVKILAGRELGFEPFTSMSGIYIINGKPTLSANLMAAALKRGGKYDYLITKMSDDEVIIDFLQTGKTAPIGTSSFSMKDAQKAGLLNKKGDIWKQYPRNMLFSRALSNGIRWYCPDIFNGITPYVEGEITPKNSTTNTYDYADISEMEEVPMPKEPEGKTEVKPVEPKAKPIEPTMPAKFHKLQPIHTAQYNELIDKMGAADSKAKLLDVFQKACETFEKSVSLTDICIKETVVNLANVYDLLSQQFKPNYKPKEETTNDDINQ